MIILKLHQLVEDIMEWIEIIDGIELKKPYQAIVNCQPSTSQKCIRFYRFFI